MASALADRIREKRSRVSNVLALSNTLCNIWFPLGVLGPSSRRLPSNNRVSPTAAGGCGQAGRYGFTAADLRSTQLCTTGRSLKHNYSAGEAGEKLWYHEDGPICKNSCWTLRVRDTNGPKWREESKVE